MTDHVCQLPDAREFWERFEDPDLEEWSCPDCVRIWVVEWDRCRECGRVADEGPKWHELPPPCKDCTADEPCEDHKYPFPLIRVSRGGIRYGTEARAGD